LIYPTSVQGSGAAEEISRTLRLADTRAECDVLILTRGGGSLEDLWAFNEEIVARAIDAVSIPVIVGVGHEIDFTIADFVADLRAPTPSQAAELAVPDQREWLARVARVRDHLCRAARRRVVEGTRRLATLSHRLHRCHPGVAVRELSQRLDELETRLKRSLERSVADRKARLARARGAIMSSNPQRHLAAVQGRCRWASEKLQRAIRQRIEQAGNRLKLAERTLDSLSPLATLERGYAIVSRHDDRTVITDGASVTPGTGVDIRLARGRLAATVDKSEPADGE
jgi:exodeoxyribonuclease VII large subunit